MTPILHTPRLVLISLRLEDAAQVQPLFARWEIVQHLNSKVPWPFPADGVETYYRGVALPAMERGEEWHWTLRLRTQPEVLIGAIGLMQGAINRGFWLGSEWQGQGLMLEAVIAVNDYWFEVLGFPVLRTSKAVANKRSRLISLKTGMRIVAVGESGYVAGRLASETWELTADQWARWREDHGWRGVIAGQDSRRSPR